MKKAFFLYNALSGKGLIKNKIHKIIDFLTQNDFEVTIRPTQAPLDAYSTTIELCKRNFYDIIICSGGDGTLNEVIQGLMNSENKIPIGYIPSGSTNDFATTLKIPKRLTNALESIVTGTSLSCDIGSFNDKYFEYIAAFGAFTEVAYETPQQYKNMLGHAAYILEGLKHISNIKSYKLKIKINNSETIDGEFIFGMVSNTASVGGLLSTGDFSVNDGLYEVTLIKTPNSLLELQSVLSSLLNLKQNINTDYVTFFKASEIDIESETDIPWTLDGEFGGSQKIINIKNNNKAVEFIINQD